MSPRPKRRNKRAGIMNPRGRRPLTMPTPVKPKPGTKPVTPTKPKPARPNPLQPTKPRVDPAPKNLKKKK